MNKIVEVFKANKKAIVKKGLIVVGAVAGLVMAGTLLLKKATANESADVAENCDVDTTAESAPDEE